MKKFAKIMLIALGFALAIAMIGISTSKPAPAQAPPPLPFTSVPVTVTNPPLEPQVASDTVTLQATNDIPQPCGPFGFAFNRYVVKSGPLVTTFTLPAGKVLVVTSWDWLASGNPAAANLARTALLVRYNNGINGASAQSTAVADSNGTAGGSQTFPSGLVLQNPGQLCIELGNMGSLEHLSATLNGFLAPDN